MIFIQNQRWTFIKIHVYEFLQIYGLGFFFFTKTTPFKIGYPTYWIS